MEMAQITPSRIHKITVPKELLIQLPKMEMLYNGLPKKKTYNPMRSTKTIR
jgi:hypothetical protein